MPNDELREDELLALKMLNWKWGWRRDWFGWHRLFWFAFMLDTKAPVVGVVVFGLSVTYGRNILSSTGLFSNSRKTT